MQPSKQCQMNYQHLIDDGYRFYEYINKNILNTIKINKDFNWNNLTTKNINGKKEYIYPAEYFRELLIGRYGG